MNKSTTHKISIFGTCATRDALSGMSETQIEIVSYTSRQSIMTAVSRPVEWTLEDNDFGHEFNKKCVKQDFLKTGISRLKEDGSTHLIIDLIDERNGILEYEGSLITNSYCLAGYCQVSGKDAVREKELEGTAWNVYLNTYGQRVPFEHYCDIFIKEILGKYKSENIIIHRVLLADHYQNTDGKIVPFADAKQKYIENINCMLISMYDSLEDKLKNCFVIDICKKHVAIETHKWGLEPFHYTDNYYMEFQEILMRYLKKQRRFTWFKNLFR